VSKGTFPISYKKARRRRVKDVPDYCAVSTRQSEAHKYILRGDVENKG